MLTCNLWLWSNSCEVLGPERGHRSSQLDVGGVASVGVEVGHGVMDNLLRFHLVGHLPLIVRASFEEPCPGKLFRTTGNHGEIDRTTIDRDV